LKNIETENLKWTKENTKVQTHNGEIIVALQNSITLLVDQTEIKIQSVNSYFMNTNKVMNQIMAEKRNGNDALSIANQNMDCLTQGFKNLFNQFIQGHNQLIQFEVESKERQEEIKQ
jgi:hypothetical protein